MSGLQGVELQPPVQARADDLAENKVFREISKFGTVLRRNTSTSGVQEWGSNPHSQQRTFSGRIKNGSLGVASLRRSRSDHTHSETRISQVPAPGCRNYCRAPNPDSAAPESLP